ncbi:altronate dehydratase large subunit [Dethiosulfatibacter aminovorans DSM 17477]|uniref:Altronate dehydratase large subunit n=1 Tax=Dethiosulfatibacter aminovorans DSM 17477 TaxID=1121476 RepID=A0A1M6JDK6_9FIRM|nr:UxaA family hydrolase [Dethiosulfatibacter aminovorans]SHJ44734.1 altronate dehydratase large subunit [Dethiosulfatibacter aminovorans DSM 17477]
MKFMGYERPDGTVGIRNKLLIIAVDECCEGIARGIEKEFEEAVVLTNWYTCMLGGNEETFNQMVAVGKNPNVAGVLVIAMGCGSILPEQIADRIAESGKMTDTLTCQKEGGTRKAVEAGIGKMKKIRDYALSFERKEIPVSRLIVGVKCGGSDTSSGIASNPSVGDAVDKMVDLGATCIAGELFELQGCQEVLDGRASSPEVAEKINHLIENERLRWSVEGTDVETMSIGNSVGGLTTIEEKSLGSLHKTGTKEIVDILQINKDFIDVPKDPGFYLSEATMLCGGAGVNFASHGAHIILWTSGAAGFNNSIVPVIRVSGNQDLFNDDMDVDARGIMTGEESIGQVSDRIVEKIIETADGQKTSIEGIGESTLTLYQKDQRLDKLLNLRCANRL